MSGDAEKLEIDRGRAAIEAERLKVEQQKLALDRARFAFEERRAEIEDKRLDIEKHKVTLEDYKVGLDRFKAEREADKPLIEAGLRFAEMGIRSLLILNGGAALGALTFAGNASRLSEPIATQWFSNLIFWLSIGAALSVATAFFSYLARTVLIEGKSTKYGYQIGAVLRVIAVVVAVSAWLVFLVTMIKAASSLGQQRAASPPSAVMIERPMNLRNMTPIPKQPGP